MDPFRQWMEGRGVVPLFIRGSVKVQFKKITAGRKEEVSETICRADVLFAFPYLIAGHWDCCRIQGMLHGAAQREQESVSSAPVTPKCKFQILHPL